jgi:hypothetical protein
VKEMFYEDVSAEAIVTCKDCVGKVWSIMTELLSLVSDFRQIEIQICMRLYI